MLVLIFVLKPTLRVERCRALLSLILYSMWTASSGVATFTKVVQVNHSGRYDYAG